MKKNEKIKKEDELILIKPNDSKFEKRIRGVLITEEEEIFLNLNIIQCFLFYIKIHKWNLFLFSINFISHCLYFFGLESCGYPSTIMCNDLRGIKWYYKIIGLAIISGIVQSIFISIILFKRKGFKHLLYDIPIYLFFFYVYDGTTVEEHGLYNSMIFLMVFVVSTAIITFIFYFIYFLIKRNRFSILFLIFSFFLFLTIYKFKPYDNCENWTKSINNTLDNDSKDYPCKIQIPKRCVLDKLGNIVDIPRYLRTECHLSGVRKKEKNIFMDSIKLSRHFKNAITKYKKFGYPITTTQDYFQKWYTDNSFASYVNDKTIIMDYYENEELRKQKYRNELPPEVILTFDDNDHGTITQKINFNKNVSEERKAISKNKKSLFKNIFMFYFDALSNKHFSRKLPKTANFLKQFFKYNPNYSEKKFTAFEFLKYQALMGFTVGNIYPMNYGFPPAGMTTRASEKGVSFIKYLKQNGFVTGSAGTICSKDSLFPDELDLPNVEYEAYDHENVALFCDRNYYDYGYSFINGINSVLHRCLYGREGYEYAFEYAELFWNSYKENKKFFRLHIYESHELTQELIKYADDKILKFFENFFEKGYFDDTLLLIISDHGNNFASYYSLFETFAEDRGIEGVLPVFKMVIPNKEIIYDSGLFNNLMENQQTFITPYDVYDTIIHASCSDYNEIDTTPKNHFEEGGIYSWRGYSLFNLIDYSKRYCKTPELDLNPFDCVCIMNKK